MIGQKFPSYIDPADAVLHGAAAAVGGDVCEGESRIDHQTAELRRFSVEVVMSAERAGVGPESRLELVLLEQDLVHGLLDGGEVEVRLGDDDAGVCELHLEHLLPKQMIPHFPLHVPVDQITLLEGQDVEESGGIFDLIQLVGSEGL